MITIRSLVQILIVSTSFLLHIKSPCQNSPSFIDSIQVFNLEKTEIMVLGTYHFDQENDIDELSPANQNALDTLVKYLAAFDPTKVVVEASPSKSKEYNGYYRDYIHGNFNISELRNEIFQIGFRMARRMEHDSIFFFDNKPPFIGNLEGFSFNSFQAYAQENDSGFYDQLVPELMSIWPANEKLIYELDLFDLLLALNSPAMTQNNIHRMHMYELRVGIGDSWIGSDWLGRWYQRNIRMLGYLLKMSEPSDRLLLIVGDNHKWILEQLINNTPNLQTVSSYSILSNRQETR